MGSLRVNDLRARCGRLVEPPSISQTAVYVNKDHRRTGFIGNKIIRKLLDRGEDVVCFDLAPHRANLEPYLPTKFQTGGYYDQDIQISEAVPSPINLHPGPTLQLHPIQHPDSTIDSNLDSNLGGWQ